MTDRPDITRDDLVAYANDLLARKGIDPNAGGSEYTIADHLTAAAEQTLTSILPAMFQTAEVREADVLAWTERYLDNPAECPNLLLSGPVGAGKTSESIGALRQIVHSTARLGRRMTYAVTSQPDFNQDMRPAPNDVHLQALMTFQTVDLLVYDDFGSGKVSDWTEDTLYRLIDKRWAEKRPTILTTNMTGKELKAALDERILSRISGSTWVALKHPDRRRNPA